MSRWWVLAWVAVASAVTANVAAAGTGWNLRWQNRVRAVEFRGVVLDSVSSSDVVAGAGGRLYTRDGYAVRCRAGSLHCTYYRPGPRLAAAPLSSEVEAAVWGFGVQGLYAKATVQWLTDARTTDAWPEVPPAVRFIDGFLEWRRTHVLVRGGRLLRGGRFGFVGWDGGQAILRSADRRFEIGAFGGVGLARATATVATDPVLAPLGDFVPVRRQRLLGASGGFTASALEARVEYLREVDPRARDFVSERAGANVLVDTRALWVSMGSDWDLALGVWGSAEAELGLRLPGGIRAQVGSRRYRPHFELWTIWGAFSPVPYHTRAAALRWSGPGVRLGARSEWWFYDDPAAATPLTTTEPNGQRWSADAGWQVAPRWAVAAESLWERSPGGGSVGGNASVHYQARDALVVAVEAGVLERPLEFRYTDTEVVSVGGSLRWRPMAQLAADLSVQHVDERRRRPDAATIHWTHWRLSTGLQWQIGSAVGKKVPDAVLRIPERQVDR